jgi:hypothetical protein
MPFKVRPNILLIIFFLSSCGGSSKHAKGLVSQSLELRVSDVELIIVGQLTRHDERVFFDTDTRYDTNGLAYDYYTYYDLFWITVHEVLKGQAAEDELLVKVLSFDQTQPHLEIDVHFFSSYNINEPGIWLIDIHEKEEPPLYAKRGNYLPMDDLEAVKEAISDTD